MCDAQIRDFVSPALNILLDFARKGYSASEQVKVLVTARRPAGDPAVGTSKQIGCFCPPFS
jgi:uncharacterized protein YfaS (alpha-2-macroglobulin family)